MMNAETRKMAVDLINDAIEKKGGYVGTKRPAYSTRQQYGGQYGRRQYSGRTSTRSSQPDIVDELNAIEKMTPDQAYRYSVSTSGRANVYGRDGRMLSGADRERADVAHALAAMPEKQFRQFSGNFQGGKATVAQMSQKLRSSPEYGGVAFSRSRNNLRGATQNASAGAGSFRMQRNNTTTGPYSGSIAARNAYVGKGTYVFGDAPQSAIAKAQSYKMPTRSYSMPAQVFGNAMSRSYASNNAKSYSNRVYAANQRNATGVRTSPRMQLAGPSCRKGSRAGCRTMQPIKRASAHGLGLVVDDYVSRFLEKRAAAPQRPKRAPTGPIDWDAVRRIAPDIDKPIQTTGGGAWSEFGQNLSSQSGNAAGAGIQGFMRVPGLVGGLLGGAVGLVGNAVQLKNPLRGAYNGFNTGTDLVDSFGGKYSLGNMRNSIQKYRDWTRDDYIKRNGIDPSQEGKWNSLDGWALRGTNMGSGGIGAAAETVAFDGAMAAGGKLLGFMRNVGGKMLSKVRGPKPPAGTPPAGAPPAGAPPAGTPPAGAPPAGAPPAGAPKPTPGAPTAAPKPAPGAPASGAPAPGTPAEPGKLRSVFNSGKELTKDTWNLFTKKIPGTDRTLSIWPGRLGGANVGSGTSLGGALFNYHFMYKPNADMPQYIRDKMEYDKLMANPENRYDPTEEIRRRSQAPAGSSYNVPGWHPSNPTSNPYLDLDVSSYM